MINFLRRLFVPNKPDTPKPCLADETDPVPRWFVNIDGRIKPLDEVPVSGNVAPRQCPRCGFILDHCPRCGLEIK